VSLDVAQGSGSSRGSAGTGRNEITQKGRTSWTATRTEQELAADRRRYQEELDRKAKADALDVDRIKYEEELARRAESAEREYEEEEKRRTYEENMRKYEEDKRRYEEDLRRYNEEAARRKQQEDERIQRERWSQEQRSSQAGSVSGKANCNKLSPFDYVFEYPE